ncbi:Rep family protein [Streptococcus handemini]|uniref:Rep family protein n=1 Tax=Streptococcus handemini TaxID=3161188 RepID=UPI00386CB2EC
MTNISEKLTPKKFAGIIHDKDRTDDNELVEPHVHIVLQFEHARSITNLAKLTDQPQNCFEKWKGSVNNAYSYLVHHTKSVLDKHLYDPREVIANFDYVELLDKIESHVNRHQKINDTAVINNYLDLLYTGQITKEEVEQRLTGSQYAKAKSKIEAVYIKYLEKKANNWREEMKEKQEPVTVIWLFGSSGTGKTRLAKQYAKQFDENFFISGSSRDSFQHYNSEHVVILDELRPNLFEYSDLLKMFDPYNNHAMASSRYFDKPLLANVYIITSPYAPYTFYEKMYLDKETDSPTQLFRRIRVLAEVKEKEITFFDYEPISKIFIRNFDRVIPNPFYMQDDVDNFHDDETNFQLLEKLSEARTNDEN